MDGEFWEVDMSTPMTVDGVARPIPGRTLPLGVRRGSRLSRHKQIDFFQRFMSAPFVPSFAGDHGLFIQRVLSLPLPSPIGERWFAALLSQFNVQKFVNSIKKKPKMQHSESSLLENLRTHLSDISLYTLNFCSELLLTDDDTLFLSLEKYGDDQKVRKKAVLHHKFPHHNLTVEAAGPELFVDQHGDYWDVPFSLGADLTSVASDVCKNYHFCINNVVGSLVQIGGESRTEAPAALLSGLSAKFAASFRNKIDIWRSELPKLRMVQPYDLFLSNPHVSVSWILGGAITASNGNYFSQEPGQMGKLFAMGSVLRRLAESSRISADMFASMSLSTQYGNFQRRLLDLTRFQMRMDCPSLLKLFSGTSRLAYDLYNSQGLNLSVVEAIWPDTTVSIQQQIAGPFSIRVDSKMTLGLEKTNWKPEFRDPVFAIEYALQVLGSAKAVAWYSPKQREFMVELRFFET